MNTMEITKIVGGLCGSLLVFLLIQSGAEAVLTRGGGHGEGHTNAFPIEVAEAEPEEETAEEEEIEVAFADLYTEADASAGESVYRACASCHKLQDGANAVGPHLYGVVGREVASVEGFNYSGALSEQADVWTPENLNGFLENPGEWAPGTKMSYRGLSPVEDRANLIAYLDSIDE